MKLMSADRWQAAARPWEDDRFRDIIWPASFRNAPRARVPAHALAVLVVITAVCEAFQGFYAADNPEYAQDRADNVLLVAGLSAVPLLLMCGVLIGALQSWRGVPYWMLAFAAWTTSVLVTPVLLLAIGLMAEPESPCGANNPEHPLSGIVVPFCVVMALAAGSLAGWIAWVLLRRRARPVALYAVWLATVTVTIVLTLAPPLHTAQTCGPYGMG
ncbi:hypothetical protein ACFXKC_09310 [Streptomyces sp. NPDC059340]|uniref:hypothetical protein n=1 Tax=Streptomyces sp. NPDC059340 TaxID=3346806 RepID=UPI0036C6D072